jgi:hypothetical protein
MRESSALLPRLDLVASVSSKYCIPKYQTRPSTIRSLTGADTVIFYDSDFNPQMDRQCEDRCVHVCPYSEGRC